MINWDNLKPLEGKQHTSFEELCYTIAKRKYGDKGRFTSIDDSGGGSGVEFYLTFPDGTQWGWQSKYFYDPNGRLSHGGRKTQIKKSLQRSCGDHPDLEKWLLCTPEDFTPGEQDWFENNLATSVHDGEQVVPDEHDIELVHWGKSEFISHLSGEQCRGVRAYFFGELELSHSWFKRIYERALESPSGKRYITSLHTKPDISDQLRCFVGDSDFLEEIERGASELNEKQSEFADHFRKIEDGRPHDINWHGVNTDFLESEGVSSAKNIVDRAVEQISRAVTSLSDGIPAKFSQPVDSEAIVENLRIADGDVEVALGEADTEAVSPTDRLRSRSENDHGDKSPESLAQQRAVDTLSDLYYALTDFRRVATEMLEYLKELQQTVLHVLGDAGTGKTHLAFDLCRSHIRANLPAILILGRNVTGPGPLRQQFLDLLDIPDTYSWQDFISALEVAARVSRGRLPIIIDGLNEAVRNGRLSDVWRNELPSLVDDLRQIENVVLVTTCRQAYVNAIWTEGRPDRSVTLHGFGRQTEEAVRNYFDYYKISANLTGAPLQQFQHPIYLRIFCEATNPDREDVKEIYLGEQKLFRVFEDFIDKCNRNIARRLGQRPESNLVRPALNRLAQKLWNDGELRVSVEAGIECIEGKPENEIENWSDSLSRAVESEGLIIYRSWSGDEEQFLFTYDLMAGYFIANYIIDKFENDLEDYLSRESVLNALYAEDFQERHPLHEDISRCLAALLPQKRGKYLHNLLKSQRTSVDRTLESFQHVTKRIADFFEGLGWAGRPMEGVFRSIESVVSRHTEDRRIEQLFNDSIDALFEVDPHYIDQDTVGYVTRLFGNPDNRSALFDRLESTWLYPNHPLGAEFIDERLQGLGMAERDLAWSEHIRTHRSDTEEIVNSLKEECSTNDIFLQREKTRLRLKAIRAMWTLTTTIRPLRDRATEALYWYGRRFPEKFFELVKRSFRINDPYVRERMLAAAYGVGMARQYDFESDTFVKKHLPSWSRFLYKAMFSSNAPCRTTHVLMRDYARHLIDMVDLHHPSLFSEEELKAARPPYEGGDIPNWGQDEGRETTKSTVGPILMDFENYTLGQLVPDRSNYDYEHPEYKKLKAKAYWRIYDLGWTMERFGKIDRRIQRRQSVSRHKQAGKTDRYGKKYSLIAFFELYGHRRDHDAVDEWESRLSDVDIDPSFPEPPPSTQVIDEDWLGSAETETEEWIESGEEPDLDSFVVLDELQNEEGPWVLLSSFFDHDDESRERDLWFRVLAVLVDEEDADDIINSEQLREGVHSGRVVPSRYYTFAGEVPWADTFPENKELSVEKVLDHRCYPSEELDIANEDEFTADELDDAIEALMQSIEDHAYDADGIDDLNELAEPTGLEVEFVTRDWKIECITHYNVLVPVWRNQWEDYHAEINQGARGDVPARQLTDVLKLVSQPQTYDLYDSSGRRATIATDYKSEQDGIKRSQRFLFIRKDLLDEYLKETDLQLLFWIAGERQYSIEVFNDYRRADDIDGPFREEFSQVHVYEQH